MKPEELHNVTVLKGGEPLDDDELDPKKVKYIVEEVIDWRKANAIHAWFVENVQNGEDDCRDYEVGAEQLQELVDTIDRVLEASKLVPGKVHVGTTWTKEKGQVENFVDGEVIKDPSLAAELLPTQSGFFFGGTEYDEYYYGELERTRKAIAPLLAASENDLDVVFEYWSSW